MKIVWAWIFHLYSLLSSILLYASSSAHDFTFRSGDDHFYGANGPSKISVPLFVALNACHFQCSLFALRKAPSAASSLYAKKSSPHAKEDSKYFSRPPGASLLNPKYTFDSSKKPTRPGSSFFFFKPIKLEPSVNPRLNVEGKFRNKAQLKFNEDEKDVNTDNGAESREPLPKIWEPHTFAMDESVVNGYMHSVLNEAEQGDGSPEGHLMATPSNFNELDRSHMHHPRIRLKTQGITKQSIQRIREWMRLGMKRTGGTLHFYDGFSSPSHKLEVFYGLKRKKVLRRVYRDGIPRKRLCYRHRFFGQEADPESAMQAVEDWNRSHPEKAIAQNDLLCDVLYCDTQGRILKIKEGVLPNLVRLNERGQEENIESARFIVQSKPGFAHENSLKAVLHIQVGDYLDVLSEERRRDIFDNHFSRPKSFREPLKLPDESASEKKAVLL